MRNRSKIRARTSTHKLYCTSYIIKIERKKERKNKGRNGFGVYLFCFVLFVTNKSSDLKGVAYYKMLKTTALLT
jgi:hypothetical protein